MPVKIFSTTPLDTVNLIGNSIWKTTSGKTITGASTRTCSRPAWSEDPWQPPVILPCGPQCCPDWPEGETGQPIFITFRWRWWHAAPPSGDPDMFCSALLGRLAPTRVCYFGGGQINETCDHGAGSVMVTAAKDIDGTGSPTWDVQLEWPSYGGGPAYTIRTSVRLSDRCVMQGNFPSVTKNDLFYPGSVMELSEVNVSL